MHKEIDVAKIFQIKKSYTKYFERPTLYVNLEYTKQDSTKLKEITTVKLELICVNSKAKQDPELIRIFGEPRRIYSNYHIKFDMEKLVATPELEDREGIVAELIQCFDRNYVINEIFKFISECLGSIMQESENRYHNLSTIKSKYDKLFV